VSLHDRPLRAWLGYGIRQYVCAELLIIVVIVYHLRQPGSDNAEHMNAWHAAAELASTLAHPIQVRGSAGGAKPPLQESMLGAGCGLLVSCESSGRVPGKVQNWFSSRVGLAPDSATHGYVRCRTSGSRTVSVQHLLPEVSISRGHGSGAALTVGMQYVMAWPQVVELNSDVYVTPYVSRMGPVVQEYSL
jgi:hypothetical protein